MAIIRRNVVLMILQHFVVLVNMELPVHPLVRWRQQYQVTQQELSDLTSLTQQEISLIERWQRIPRGDSLERLISTTHLPTDALVRPRKFLEANPDFGVRKH
jgi:transcriptional regulator with XRE-family HTH domain